MFSLRLKSRRQGKHRQIIDFDEEALTNLSMREAMAELAKLSKQQPEKKKSSQASEEVAPH